MDPSDNVHKDVNIVSLDYVDDTPDKGQSTNLLQLQNVFDYDSFCEEEKNKNLSDSSMFLQTLNLKSKDMSDPYNISHTGGKDEVSQNYDQLSVKNAMESSSGLDRFIHDTNARSQADVPHALSYPNFLSNDPPSPANEFKSETNAFDDSDNQNSLGKTLAKSLNLIASEDGHHVIDPHVDSHLPNSGGIDELPSSHVEPSDLNSCNDSVSSTTPEAESTPISFRYRTRSLSINEKSSPSKDDAQSENNDSSRESKEERISSTEDEPLYRCDQCDKIFHKKQTLRQHFITHTDRFACSFCNVRCKSKGDLRSHTQTHTKEKPFHCEVCNTFYTRESILKKHKTTQLHKSACIKADKARYSRKKRGKKALSELSFQTDEHDDFQKEKWVCSECFKVFSSSKALRKHSKMHEFSFTCSKCQRKCKSSTLLKLHEKCHVKSATLSCRLCSRSFSLAATLKEHVKSHFRQKDRYSRMMYEKGYQIVKEPSIHSICESAISVNTVKSVTPRAAKKPRKQQEILLCQSCPRQFKSLKAFEKHCAKHLKSPELSRKDETRRAYSSLEVDSDERTNFCAECNTTFDTLESLTTHRNEFHETDALVCNICYSVFKDSVEYKNHVQNHAPTMLFSGESLEDNGVPMASKKVVRRCSGNRTSTSDSLDNGTKTMFSTLRVSNEDHFERKEDLNNENMLSCYEFMKLIRNTVVESSDEGGLDDNNGDIDNESDDEQFYQGLKHLFHFSAKEINNDCEVDISSTPQSHLDKDLSSMDRQAFFENHTVQDFENSLFKCAPCSVCFMDNDQLADHIKSHACDSCQEFFIDTKTLLEHKCRCDLKLGKQEFCKMYEFARLDEVSSTSEDEANDLFLDELESILDCETKATTHIDLLHTYTHDEIVKTNKKTFERYSCIDIPTNIYACTICKRKYARPTTLTRHFKTHVCHYCNKFFIDKSDLIEHKYKHRQKAALLKAEISGEQSTKVLHSPLVSKVNRELFKKFTLIDSSRNMNKCCLCEKTFVRKTVLTRHMKTHICSYCDKFYEDKYELARHVGMHKIDTQASEDGGEAREYNDFEDDEKPYSSRTTLSGQLESDGKVVTLDPTFSSSLPHFSSTFATPDADGHETLTFIEIPVPESCENTGNVAFGNNNETVTSTYQIISDSIDAFKESAHESFIVDGSACQPDDPNKIITIAQSQIMTADGNQERLNLFECTLCGKTFFKSGHLKSHMSTHTVRKPHICHLCGKSFVRRGALKRHEKSHDIKRCKFCDTSFNYQFELDDHMQMHESYPFYK